MLTTNDIKYHPGGPVPNELFCHKQYKYNVLNTMMFMIRISRASIYNRYVFTRVYFNAFRFCRVVESVGKMFRFRCEHVLSLVDATHYTDALRNIYICALSTEYIYMKIVTRINDEKL